MFWLRNIFFLMIYFYLLYLKVSSAMSTILLTEMTDEAAQRVQTDACYVYSVLSLLYIRIHSVLSLLYVGVYSVLSLLYVRVYLSGL